MVRLTIDGIVREARAGRASRRRHHAHRDRDSARLLSPAARPDPDLRHLHGRGRTASSCGPARRVVADGMTVEHRVGRGARAAQTRGVRPHPQQSPALLHGLRQQQRQLHRPQHDEAARDRASADPVPAQAVRGRRHQSVLSLRSRPVHPLRPLRRGLPERRGQRDAVDQLGGSASARAVGRRLDDSGVELRLVRPLRDGLSLQRADGEVDARPRRLLHRRSRSRRSSGMIDVVKGVEPETGYRRDPAASRKRKQRCASIASAARRRSAPTAASAAASTSGPRTATSSRSRPSTARPTASPPA